MSNTCHDCGAQPGQPHVSGCDVERCSVCGGQRLACGCPGHDPQAAYWAGEWPGKADARRLGLWCRWVEGEGWVKCNAEHPDATEDLNELARVRRFQPERLKEP